MCSLQSHWELQVSVPIGALPSLPKPSTALMQYNSTLVETRHCHFIMRKTAGRRIQHRPLPAKTSSTVSPLGFYRGTLTHTELAQGTGEGGSCQDAACRRGQPVCFAFARRDRGGLFQTRTAYCSVEEGEMCRLAQGTALRRYSHRILPPALGTFLTRVWLHFSVPALHHLFSFPPSFFWSCGPFPSKMETQEGNREECYFCWRLGNAKQDFISPRMRWGKKGEPRSGEKGGETPYPSPAQTRSPHSTMFL